MTKEIVRTLPASRGDPLVDDIVPDDLSPDVVDMDQTTGPEQQHWAASISGGTARQGDVHHNILHMHQHVASPDAARQAGFDRLDRGLEEAVRRHDDRFP
jgi:hypothetical protein